MSIAIGLRSGRLTVVGRPFVYNRASHAVCECECGRFVIVRGGNLGEASHCTKSCGCLYREKMSRGMNYRHGGGLRGSSLQGTWRAMRARCNSPKHLHFRHYGGRGIRVCAEWEDFAVFKAWAMANGWKEGLTIDRKENDGHYEPGNCQWLTRAENTAKARREQKSPA